MAEQKNAERPAQQPEPKKESAPEPKKAPAPSGPLGSAGASTDPAVHQLLAERAIAVSNDDRDAVDAADDKLAELGVSVE